MTPNSVPSTFLWHRPRNTDHKTFSFFSFSLSSKGSPIACFRCFLHEEQNHHENAANRGFKHCGNTKLSSVLVRGWAFDKSEKLWFGSLMSIVSLSTLCLHLTWPAGQTSRCKCGSTGKYGKISWMSESARSPSDRAGTARMGESWEGRKRDGERDDTCAKNLYGTLEPFVYMYTHEDVRSTQWARCAVEKSRKFCSIWALWAALLEQSEHVCATAVRETQFAREPTSERSRTWIWSDVILKPFDSEIPWFMDMLWFTDVLRAIG